MEALLLRSLACGLVAWAALASALANAVWAAPARVALLPVAVHTAEKDSDYLSLGLADMLSSRLERTGHITVLRLRGEGLATTDAAAAQAAARAAGADYVLFGSFTQFGAGASLDMRCARVEADESAEPPEARRVFVQSGTLQEIIPRLDELSERVARYVSGSAPAAAADEAARTAESGALEDLKRRVEALERSQQAAPGAATAAGAAAAPSSAIPSPGVAPEATDPERLR